jgi:hypothetical protein
MTAERKGEVGMKKLTVLGLTVLVVVLMAGGAHATYISPTGGDGLNSSLQDVLNSITVGPTPGVSSIDVDDNQVGYDETWSITATGGSFATIIIELAGYANFNTFGVYDVNDIAKTVQLFASDATIGSQTTLSIKADGSVYINLADSGVDFAGNNFGYYLLNKTGHRFYSQTALNSGDDHMVAFRGNDKDIVQIPGLAEGVWTSSEYVLGWEDLPRPGDQDYQDLVLMVESVTPVPEPATLLLIGSGLIGLGAFGRKKRA